MGILVTVLEINGGLPGGDIPEIHNYLLMEVSN